MVADSASTKSTRAIPRLVVDCDPGIDDAIALCFLAHQVQAGLVDMLGVTTVAGNVELELTCRNAAFVLAENGLGEVPVFKGAAAPLHRSKLDVDASDFHGSDGLGGLYAPRHRPPLNNGAGRLVQFAMDDTATGPSWLLALGPLTNLAKALEAAPPLANAFERVVVMGGAFGAPAGNITEFAEYNFYVDPIAAAIVCVAGFPITLVPLDVTHQVVITAEDVARLEKRSGGATLASHLLRASINNYWTAERRNGCIMHDALAAAILVQADLVECDQMSVAVETEGRLRGHAKALRQHDASAMMSVEVAMSVDASRARDVILDSLAAAITRQPPRS